MKVIYFLSFILFGLFSNSLPALADDNMADKIQDFETYYQKHYQELIYIQVDKDYYMAGEQMKLKVLCLEGTKSRPSKLSKVAYVEVMDEENSSTLQAKILLENGVGYGEIYIPTSQHSGNYIVRGYTRWMKNFGPNSYFHSMTTIINPFRNLGLSPKPLPENATMNFYPESGTLLDGVESKVVFEGLDSNGSPFSFCGKLIEDDNTIILEFCSSKSGMGSFTFTPQSNKKYRAEISLNGKVSSTHALPTIQDSGASIAVQDTGNKYEFHIHGKGKNYDSDLLYYVIHSHGKIVASKRIMLVNAKSVSDIDKDGVPEGVSAITLFSSQGTALCSRSFFKRAIDKDVLSMELSQKTYSTREKVRVDVSSLNKGLTPEEMNLSISVASHHKQFDPNHRNLSDHLLLGQSINGYVFNLEALFDGSDPEAKETIDRLLIAHAKDDFIWKNIEQEEAPEYIPEYHGPIVSGTIRNKFTQEPTGDIMTYLSIPGKNIRFFTSRSRRDGSFIFELKEVYGRNEIVIQNDNTRDTIYSINIDDPFSHEYADIDLPPLNLDEKMEKWIIHQSKNMQIENANLKFQPQQPLLTTVDSSSFYYEPDSRYYLDDFTRFIVMEEVMREYVYGVNVRINKQGYHFMALDIERNIIFKENPLMLLDGVPVFDADEIIDLDPLKVEKIETVKRRFHKGYLDCMGIVTYTTYDGDLDGYTLHKNAMVIDYDAVQPLKQYYFTEYPSAFKKKVTTPDFRNTLYWNPEFTLDEKGNASIEFYTSDDVNHYEINLVGLGKNGEVYSKSIRFEVTQEHSK